MRRFCSLQELYWYGAGWRWERTVVFPWNFRTTASARNTRFALKGSMTHTFTLGTDARGNFTRMDNTLAGLEGRKEKAQVQLENLHNQQEAAKAELGKPFPQEAELAEKSARLAELTPPSIWTITA